ncbi:lipoyl(octanoyl) transferase [Chitinophaga caeni]|uniref:Octanoyltransferase n=1 Tax=Chitinophaga caeni TaxID=2029983 RepID=A0A291QUS1_9BACT|nr:lipoyl(octanoyl) transferase LipB [Chitinophaga caeni]ATL47632.1 lipoyl(octanoyl) transferase [Chitinophaga caeni]
MKQPEVQQVWLKDLGKIDYQDAWDLQEQLLQQNLAVKKQVRDAGEGNHTGLNTRHHLLFCEHSPVYTLGKSGHLENLLINNQQLQERGIQFVHTNRGGDITFHGEGQIVGYPILDLEQFYTDIGKYLRNIEEVIIKVLAHYNIKGDRSKGETGVWLDPHDPAKARKICAMGVRCSRWVTMHGFALNVNTDMNYFNYIVPCGIVDKKVTSLEQELGRSVDMDEVKGLIREAFQQVFEVQVKDEMPMG